MQRGTRIGIRRAAAAAAIFLAFVVTGRQAEAGFGSKSPHTVRPPLSRLPLSFEVDSTWNGANGYWPVRFRVTPLAPPAVDESLTVEVSTRWYNTRKVLATARRVDLPAGATQTIETLFSLPCLPPLESLDVRVLLDGQELTGGALSISLGGSLRMDEFDGAPAWLHLDDAQRPAAAPNIWQVQQQFGGAAGAVLLQIPWRELPVGWRNLSGIDLVTVTWPSLKQFAQTRPDAWNSVRQWVLLGGNLIVADLTAEPDAREALEKLFHLAGEAASGASAWQRPLARHFSTQLVGLATVPNYGGEPLRTVEPSLPPEGPMPIRTTNLDPQTCSLQWRACGFGTLCTLDRSQEMQNNDLWLVVLNAIGPAHWQWHKRHGLSHVQDNPDFWNFLIPGVGRVPVGMFLALITAFVAVIGPLNYYLLRKRAALQWLVITIPTFSLAITACLFAYFLLADGLGVRVRARSVTQLDQRTGEAQSWARLSYYSGLTPAGGLTFSEDVALFPLNDFAELAYRDTRPTRTFVEHPSQEAGPQTQYQANWLRARTPTQFMTLHARRTGQKLEIESRPGEPPRVVNQLGARVSPLLLRDADGQLYWSDAVEPGAAAELSPIEPAAAGAKLRELSLAHELSTPENLNFAALRQGGRRRSYYYYYGSNRAMDAPTQSTGLLEQAVTDALRILPGTHPLSEDRTYLALCSEAAGVELGREGVRQEASLHLIQGRW